MAFFTPTRWGRAKPPLGYQVDRGHPLAAGLQGFWLLNEAGGLKALDVSGVNNNATFQGGSTWSRGLNGPAVNFDGTTGYLEATPLKTGVAGGMPAGPPYTTAAWVLLTDSAANHTVMGIGIGGSANSRSDVYFNSLGTFYLRAVDSAGTLANNDSTFAPSLNTWYQVTDVRTSATSRSLYVNGILRTSVNEALGSFAVPDTVRIGATPFTSVVQTWQGLVGSAGLWSRALPADQVWRLFTNFYDLILPLSRRTYFMQPAAATFVGDDGEGLTYSFATVW